jgi:hypothetical protein
MRTTGHPIRYLVQLIGTGLMLVSLVGCLSLPVGSGAGVEPTAYREYQNYRDYQDDRDDRGYQDYRDYRDYRDYQGYGDYQQYRAYQRRGYDLPERYTIHKGKKCEIRCERIWGTRDYDCREYRC